MARNRLHLEIVLFVCALMASCLLSVAGSVAYPAPAAAQNSNTNTWLPALNLSNSGAASQPVISVAGNGTTHVLWWDSFDGMRYQSVPRAVSGTLTLALSGTRSVIVPGLWGDRQAQTDSRTNKQTVTLTAPRTVRLVTDRVNRAHAFWPNVTSQLLYATTVSAPGAAVAQWAQPVPLADSASAMDVTADVSNTLHLAFARPTAAVGLPPGLYYRAKSSAGWSPATLVYSNTYFRADRPEDVTVKVAANGQGAVVITWYQARVGQSFFAHSTNFGRTWSPPELVSGSATQSSAQTDVVLGLNGDLLLVYRDPTGQGCGFNQRKSQDAGKTWGAPEVILGDMSRCPARWRFANATGKLWMIGSLTQGGSSAVDANPSPDRIVSNILASWNGAEWSTPAEFGLSVPDSAIRQNRALGCLSISIAGESMAGVGCDARGDVWLSQAAIGLDKLIVAPDLTWSKFALVSNRQGPVAASVAMALSKQTDLYALWSQADPTSATPNEIYFTHWNNTGWLQPSKIIGDPKQKFEQVSVAASPDDKLHAVWNGGMIRYSQAFARDAAVAKGWAAPQDLPLPANTNAGRSPVILADPRGNALYVIFSVPYNEKRGIYMTRSDDGGTTWKAAVQVFDAVAANWESADQPQIQLDAQDNVLHAVWLKANLGNRLDPQAVYYARSTDGGQTWSAAQMLAEGNVDAPQLAIPARGQVYVLWNQRRNTTNVSAPFETWGQLSLDGGARWTDSLALPGFREISGKVALTSDGAGRLYLTGITENAGSGSELVYSSWSGQDWSQRETFGIGQVAASGNTASTGILPAEGRLVVLARTAVLSDSGKAQFELISTDRKISDAPIVIQPTFTPVAIAVATDTPASTPAPTGEAGQPALLPTNIPASAEVNGPTVYSRNLIIGIAGALVFGTLVILYGFWSNRRR